MDRESSWRVAMLVIAIAATSLWGLSANAAQEPDFSYCLAAGPGRSRPHLHGNLVLSWSSTASTAPSICMDEEDLVEYFGGREALAAEGLDGLLFRDCRIAWMHGGSGRTEDVGVDCDRHNPPDMWQRPKAPPCWAHIADFADAPSNDVAESTMSEEVAASLHKGLTGELGRTSANTVLALGVVDGGRSVRMVLSEYATVEDRQHAVRVARFVMDGPSSLTVSHPEARGLATRGGLLPGADASRWNEAVHLDIAVAPPAAGQSNCL